MDNKFLINYFVIYKFLDALQLINAQQNCLILIKFVLNTLFF